MYVKSMVLDGFKSYGKRVEITGFDKEFNAITGFNGSGKSNILDAICFVLGLTNLSQVRATSLQDLVYKSGQAGVKKASVSITFDNRNKESSPFGYEHFDEITVTRQVVIGGRTKYLINGTNVPNKRIQDMFCSVQLNVNNPHFLIMQGRITKVLNMKPLEILSMIEEAAGTRMYETKKQAALKTIEKKNARLKEIDDILKEEIMPKLRKLKEEKTQYVEFQRIERELQHYQRLYVAWKYMTALSDSEKAEREEKIVKDRIAEKTDEIAAGAEEIKAIEERLIEVGKQRDAAEGGKLEELKKELQEAEKRQIKLTAELNSAKENAKVAEKTLSQLRANLTDDEGLLAQKEKEYEKIGGLFQELKERDESDARAVLEAQERYQKVSSGLLESEQGEFATLEQQLINAKQNATQARTELKQCEMILKHSQGQLAGKEAEMKSTVHEYGKDSKSLEAKEKELKNLENELRRLDYSEGSLEELQSQRRALTGEIKELREKVDRIEANYPRVRFDYRPPDRGFNKNSVKGLVCNLMTVKDPSTAYALEMAAGGKLYNVVVDTDSTGKKLLQHGQLQQRVTFIPLNRVSGSCVDERTIKLAQSLVGPENVQPALALLDFPEEVRPAMQFIFGNILQCSNMDAAKQVAFHRSIMKKCVTLEGDIVDPSGVLSGGAPARGGSMLLKLQEMKAIQGKLNEKERALAEIESKIANIGKAAESFAALKQRLDLLSYEVELVRQRLQQTTHHKIKEEVESLRASIKEATEKMSAARKQEAESLKRAKELEAQIKDAGSVHQKQLKEAEARLASLRKKAEESRREWEKRQQESVTLDLEMKELRGTLESGKQQLEKAEEELATLKAKVESLKEESKEAKEVVHGVQEKVKEETEVINRRNKDIQKLLARKESIVKQTRETELDIQKLNYEIKTFTSSAKDCQQRVNDLVRKNPWIEQDKAYFGKEGGIYDFTANKPDTIAYKVKHLEAGRDRLSRSINTRAINLLDKEEEQYNTTVKKKKIVETDKARLIDTIIHLDEKKKEALTKACEQVNKDFGSIFSTLLPGADAKLQPLAGKQVIDGLEVKVGFSGVWKESLGELSGGQRSLVALSLILAMLLFKPAPLYILDEVDAALDLSHTENIGTMLKRHFKHSQFIVVSLKDGMFNNANVLFRTKFVDGMSAVIRSVK